MKIEDCRIGMKVRAVRKTRGEYGLGEFKYEFPTGEFTIKNISLGRVYTGGTENYIFSPSDLEPVEELYICNHAGKYSECVHCAHNTKHTWCERGCSCDDRSKIAQCFGQQCVYTTCIPYKEEAMPEERFWICNAAESCIEPSCDSIAKQPHDYLPSCEKRRFCEQRNIHVQCIPYKEATMPKEYKSLGFVEAEAKKEYESLKPITLLAMREAGACNSQRFRDFCIKAINAGLQWDDEIPAYLAMTWAKTDFLVDKGFVRERKVEKNLVFTIIETSDRYTVKCENFHVADFFKDRRGYRLHHGCGESTFETDERGRIRVIE